MRSVCRIIRQLEVVEVALQRTILDFAFDPLPGKPLFDFVPELAAGACVRTKGLRRDSGVETCPASSSIRRFERRVFRDKDSVAGGIRTCGTDGWYAILII